MVNKATTSTVGLAAKCGIYHHQKKKVVLEWGECLTYSLSLLDGRVALSSGLLLALPLLQQGLRYEDLVLCWDRSIVGIAISMVRWVIKYRRVGTAAMARHSQTG